ncbi:hypothetical protein A5669_00970 [Mycolicibacterium fortuitum]|nr:hypothetical protein A5669_00970 [Mycolicibacterium fortuitum]
MMHHRSQHELINTSPQKHCTKRDLTTQIKRMTSHTFNDLGDFSRRRTTHIDNLPTEVNIL